MWWEDWRDAKVAKYLASMSVISTFMYLGVGSGQWSSLWDGQYFLSWEFANWGMSLAHMYNIRQRWALSKFNGFWLYTMHFPLLSFDHSSITWLGSRRYRRSGKDCTVGWTVERRGRLWLSEYKLKRCFLLDRHGFPSTHALAMRCKAELNSLVGQVWALAAPAIILSRNFRTSSPGFVMVLKVVRGPSKITYFSTCRSDAKQWE